MQFDMNTFQFISSASSCKLYTKSIIDFLSDLFCILQLRKMNIPPLAVYRCKLAFFNWAWMEEGKSAAPPLFCYNSSKE